MFRLCAGLAGVSASALLMLVPAPIQAEALSPQIVGGQLSSQWPGVGGVFIPPDSLCTGFAITSRWIMTAAHCVAGATHSTLSFLVGSDVALPDIAVYAVDQVIVDPGFNVNDITAGHDAALLHIKDVDLPVLPFKLNSQSLAAASMVGTHMLTLGYGTTGAAGNGSGSKRVVQVTISNLEGAFIEIENTTTGTCSGDSGGPAYVYDSDGFPLVLGLTSFGDQNCEVFGGFQRVDVELSFVMAAVTSGLCSNGQSCEGIFRDGVEPPL